MSIMVQGTLSVQRIIGANGEFSVGKLDCEIGVLNVKDPYLDQFATGAYTGRFGIAKVYAHGYSARTGAFIIEIRAVLDQYIIHTDEPDSLHDDIALRDEDPLQAEPSVPPAPAPMSEPPVCEPVVTPADFGVPDEEQAMDPIAELFGELWPLGREVKLDPTSIRSDGEGHRKRCQYLKSEGYTFRASTQSWHLTSGA